MKWVNFLHIYQPPTQSKETLELVTHESYEKIISLLEKFPKLKLTMNIAGSLIELLENNGKENVLRKLAAFVADGRIELVGSAMYHPILPLIHEDEITQQIQLHNDISKKWFGENYKPKGFYFPEMAYSKEAAAIVQKMGFDWTILDERQISSEKINPGVKYILKDSGLAAIFRNHKISYHFPPESVFSDPETLKYSYLITAHDGELYGHWHKDDRGFYDKAFSNPEINFLTASEYLGEIKTEKLIEVPESNWESVPEDIKNGIPFALWNHPDNLIHNDLWSLAKQANSIINLNLNDPHIDGAKRHFHRGLASCAWWWASNQKIGPFSSLCWNPTEIEKGARELLAAIQTLKNADSDSRIQFEKKFGDLRDNIWTSHWRK